MPIFLLLMLCVLFPPAASSPPVAVPDVMPAKSLFDIPPPREPGKPSPPPNMMVPPSGIRPEAIQGWVNNLGSEEFRIREQAEAGLLSASWDGYRAAVEVLATSENPESRHRADRVRRKYLGSALKTVMETRWVPAQPAAQYVQVQPAHYKPVPKIYTLACSLKGEHGQHPSDQYALAMLCHYYTLKAVRRNWESQTDGSQAALPTWDASVVNQETLATQLMIADLLAAGFDPLWVRWLLDDMDLRTNYWPPALKRPPGWLLAWMGVEMYVKFPQ